MRDGEDVRLEINPDTAEAYVKLRDPEIAKILADWFEAIAAQSELVHQG